MKYSLSILSLATGLASGHMIMNDPSVWGSKTQGVSLENPLNLQFTNWLHHGASKDTNEFITLNPGSTKDIFVTCGEAIGKPEQASSLCQTVADVHQGGGCAISIAYPDASGSPRSGANDFTIISVKHDCPTFGAWKHGFQIPSNLPKCDNCVCAWHWVPNPMSSADESYMNTFNCKVGGTTSGTITNPKKPLYWGVPGGLPLVGRRQMYNNGAAFPNGAQSLTLEKLGGSGNEDPTITTTIVVVPVPSPTPTTLLTVTASATATSTPVEQGEDEGEETSEEEDAIETPSAEHGGWGPGGWKSKGRGRGGRGGRRGGRRGGNGKY